MHLKQTCFEREKVLELNKSDTNLLKHYSNKVLVRQDIKSI